MKSLHISLPQKWFDQVKSGRKTIEYKEIKKYWVKRLIQFDRDINNRVFDEFSKALKNPFDRYNGPEHCMEVFGARFRKIETAVFKNGCVRHDQPVLRFARTIASISVDQGDAKWDTRPGDYYFVIQVSGP